ncbi:MULTISPECIES: CvpA family protein [Alkalihalophilus]|uniref:CvpA family protein n=2 Tax=Alkalihalophilus TaxID=2893060 RepID=A0AAJ2NNX8_ALKPS|nr:MULTISPECIES: CvpA family protein [Alkalihalophilus]ERN52485.1 membrane protein [Alkalihalophilus marmarensis DSM 21297]MCM3487823.1 CvpA family protein [Alkalihalophilus marmarensis]MDV2885874.1 CvpA family protein [Alkalihalophilus pseudofirmus]MEC2071685.1 CvpA family protein [Alkalihalophilus marmarensis]MED1602863.1 CvpA family protein [Alkalihalophilus marmarensis]
MLSFLILLLLLMSFFIGRRRGLILQLIHLVGFIVSLYVAYTYYQEVASYIQLWIPYPQFSQDSTVGMIINSFNGESVYYSGIAFAILFFGTKILLHIVGSMLDFVAHLPILRSINRLLGSIFCFVETYLILFILLYVAALLPVDLIQDQLQRSIVAQTMMNYTPFLSDWIRDLWIRNDLGA